MKVRLNLATSPLENHRRFALGATLMGLLALGSFVVLAQRTYANLKESRDVRGRIAVLQREMRDLQEEQGELENFFKRPDVRNAMDRAAFLNGLIARRSFPWTRIFSDLEERLPEGVRVVSIAPRMDEGRVEVRMVVGALSDEAKLKFVRTLETAKEFSSVQVVSETRPRRPGEADKVQLELVAWYASQEK